MTDKEKELVGLQRVLAYSFVGLVTIVIVAIVITLIVMAFSGPALYKTIFWGLVIFVVAIFILYWIGRGIIYLKDS